MWQRNALHHCLNLLSLKFHLTQFRAKVSLYRNPSTDFPCKSVDWFHFNGKIISRAYHKIFAPQIPNFIYISLRVFCLLILVQHSIFMPPENAKNSFGFLTGGIKMERWAKMGSQPPFAHKVNTYSIVSI